MRTISFVGFSNETIRLWIVKQTNKQTKPYSAMNIVRVLNRFVNFCNPIQSNSRMTDSAQVMQFISAKQTRNCYVADRLHMKDELFLIIILISGIKRLNEWKVDTFYIWYSKKKSSVCLNAFWKNSI